MRKSAAALAAVVVFFGLRFFAHATVYEPPILMYHMVDIPVQKSGVCVRPDNFERQMEFLKLHRYRVISLEQLVREIQSGKRVAPKTVVITFDDGTLDNFRNAFPVLRKMDFPATIFMITDNVNHPGWLAEEDLKILDESGITIGSHTVHHAFLPPLSEELVVSELAESRQALESVLAHPVKFFSYPAGGVTPRIEQLVKQAGYEAAVTTNYAAERGDVYALRRIKIGDSSGNLFNFWAKTSGYYHLGKKQVSYEPHMTAGVAED